MLLNGISQKPVQSKFHFTYDNNFVLQISCKSENKTHPHFRPILLPCLYLFFRLGINSPSTRHHLLINEVIYLILW